MMDHDYGFQMDPTAIRDVGYRKEGQGSLPHLPAGYNHCNPDSSINSVRGECRNISQENEHSRTFEKRQRSCVDDTNSQTGLKDKMNKGSELGTQLVNSKNYMHVEEDDNKPARISVPKGAPKQSQISATLKWLTENYEKAEGVCLPRCVLYTHYLDFCKKQNFSPAGAATFGKIIRQKFPKLTTRRLGTRGQSKYHYYGIGIKESSIYYHSVYTGKGLTRFSGSKVKTEGSNRKYSLSSKTGTLLPEFPDAHNLVLPEGVDNEKIQTFIMMYRTHCQRILDTVISANFDEVQSFLLHFWQGMPEHLIDLLNYDLITDLVGLCDSILYKVLVDVLIPSTIQDLPDSLSAEIRVFVKKLGMWLDSSLDDVPKNLRSKKLEVLKTFSQSVKRQMSFVHLAQTARAVVQSTETVSAMLTDLSKVDFGRVCDQACYTNPLKTEQIRNAISNHMTEFVNLLKQQAAIESFTEWADGIIDQCVLEGNPEKNFSEAAAQFLLQWTLVCSLVMRDLTLCSASSFGSFHLLHMMLDEYAFLVMETKHNQDKENILQAAMKTHQKVDEDICTEAKVRSSLPRGGTTSPKPKKRHLSIDSEDLDSDGDTKHCPSDHMGKDPDTTPCDISAFSRTQGVYRDTSYPYPAENQRVFNAPPAPSYPSMPSLKHYSPVHGNTFERAQYFSHLSINTYPDYMTQTPPIPSPRLPNGGDAHVQAYPPPGPLPGGGYSVSPTSAPYWGETRPHHANLHDPYGGYPSYNKYTASYDGYNRPGGLLRGGPYQDTIARSAFEPPRGLYERTTNRQITGGGFAYGGGYMDITHHPAQCPQYPRQDMVLPHHHQEDFYPPNMTSALPLAKAYVTPFR